METTIITCDRCKKETKYMYDMPKRKKFKIYIQEYNKPGEEILKYNDICDSCVDELKKKFKKYGV